MPTPSSGTITMAQINAEFGRGNNLNAYRGTYYYTTGGVYGTFPTGAISFSDFYGKQVKAPAGSQTFTSSGSFTVPLGYTSVTVCMSGGGGSGCASSVGIVGGNYQGGAGGGGSGSISTTYACSPGQVISVTIGAGGVATQDAAAGRPGGASYFGSFGAAGASGATNTWNVSQAQGGSGVNGGGRGGNSSWNVNPSPGGGSSGCGGSFSGGAQAGNEPGVFGGAGGGGGGFGNGANGAYGGNAPGINAASGSGAGGSGNAGQSYYNKAGNGGSGRCVISWS